MQPGSLELNLVQGQFENNASIFTCNDYSVISPKKVLLGRNQCGAEVWTLVNPSAVASIGHYGQDGDTTSSFLNTMTFIRAWDLLLSENKIWKSDWAVKVDPDAVFFPARLREHVRAHTGRPVIILNCFWENTAKLFGAIEVFSKQAMLRYQQGEQKCKALDWHGWGEDYYMQTCMKLLEVESVEDYSLVGDDRCKHHACTDNKVVAYHPYKDPAAYWTCFGASPK